MGKSGIWASFLFSLGCDWRKEQVPDQWYQHTEQPGARLLQVGPAERQQPAFPDYAGTDYQSAQHETSRNIVSYRRGGWDDVLREQETGPDH